MKIPCLRPAPGPEHTTIIPAYRAAIAKKKGLLPALIWGENNEANRELLDEVARSIDRGLLHERAYSEALLMQGASLLQVSEGIERVLRGRAVSPGCFGHLPFVPTRSVLCGGCPGGLTAGICWSSCLVLAS